MTAVLPRTSGRHRAPETDEEPRWSTPAEFTAAWTRAGRHAAPEEPGRHSAPEGDVFDWLGFAPVAG